MNARATYVGIPLLSLALIALGVWWWTATFEKRWIATPNTSDIASQHPMLAAQRLLHLHHHPVEVDETLSAVLLKPAIPDGTMIIAENANVMTTAQVRQILAWVARGNTLITGPAWEVKSHAKKPPVIGGNGDDDDDDGEDSAVAPDNKADARASDGVEDDIGAHFGVSIGFSGDSNGVCRSDTEPEDVQKKNLSAKMTLIDCNASLSLPGASYPLQLGPNGNFLVAQPSARNVLFFDEQSRAVRGYEYGSGRVIFSAMNYFDNDNLPSYDRAELLLALIDQNQNAKRVIIVEHLDLPNWFSVLWAAVPQALCTLALGLILLGWAAVRRFGPLLPEPDLMRRAVLEHVEASSRWLWRSGKGREMLLDAARAATMKLLLRRVPQLHRASEEDKVAQLAEQTGLLRSDIDAALHNGASARPQEFTRQIQTLQRLRKHYER